MNLIYLNETESSGSTIIEKEKEYLEYINSHINAVKQAYKDKFIPLLYQNNNITSISDKEFKQGIIKAKNNILNHDKSKFDDIEFYPYRKHWYPTPEEVSNNEVNNREDYDNAWEHHYSTNPHHTEYWIHNNIKSDMQIEYIIEMLCDWFSFEYLRNQDCKNWYESDKSNDVRQNMSENTKNIVEDILYNVL